MDSIQLRAAGKVNLFLEILGLRSDGYHDLQMILQSVDLADRVTLRPACAIAIVCEHPLVPCDRSNLAWRAVELLQADSGLDAGVEITIEKRIPVASGMAGGSTNAAAVLVGLNQLWDLGLTVGRLQELGGRLGADVPFCIEGGTALGTGRGDVLSPLTLPGELHLVVAKPRELQVSTAWAYRTFRHQYLESRTADRANLPAMLAAIAAHDLHRLAGLLFNDLEAAVLPAHPEVEALRRRFLEHGALGAMMSGSGPSVFALAASRVDASRLYDAMIDDPTVEVHLCQTTAFGVEVETIYL